MKKPIRTMEELAATIAVSRPTLSRFFHDRGSVRASTRARIEAALNEVDYVPNFFAIHLNRAKTRLIGVVVPHLTDIFQMTLVSTLETEAAARGHRLVLQNTQNDPGREAEALTTLRSMNVDGLIVSPTGAGREAGSELARLEPHAAQVPVVLVDSLIEGAEGRFDFVGTDLRQSIGLIVDYLLRRGQVPAFLSMPAVNRNAAERDAAYKAAMEAAGLAPVFVEPAFVEPVFVEPPTLPPMRRAPWAFEHHGYETMAGHFAQGRHTEGTLLCASDRLAMGALKAAHDFGLFPSGQVGRFRIAGHDNDPVTRYLHPNLTTVEQDLGLIARTALDLVLRPPGAPKETRRIPARMVIRDSA